MAVVAGYLHLQARDANILLKRQLAASTPLEDTARITDGRAAAEGARWDGEAAIVLPKGAQLVYDLGVVQPVGCLWLQADNNDHYRVDGSRDGRHYITLWEIPPVAGAGLRLRYAELAAETRFLRLQPEAGDGRFSVSEFGAAAHCPQHKPVGLRASLSLPLVTKPIDGLLLLTAAIIVCALFVSRQAPAGLYVLLSVLASIAVIASAIALYLNFPFFHYEPALRASLALVAGGVIVNEFLSDPDARSSRQHTAVLLVAALLSLGCYYHFGALQFHDGSKGRQSFVHPFDMRHYFPQAKYFPELRFDGLYLASLAAYVDETGIPAERLVNTQLRDLSTNEVRRAPEVAGQLDGIRARFTAERWQEFRKDMRYFMGSMGGDYLASMQDHGGNATPVWVLGAWLIFRTLPANELTLTLAGLIDPVLLLLLFVCIARSFSLRTLLYCMILFGATDFYQFGSNLVGSTLRQDWLVALGLGACALKTGRFWLGGALLAYAGLIRAFPAMATFALLLPPAWWLFDQWRLRRRASSSRRESPSWSQLWQQFWPAQSAAIKSLLAAFVTVLSLVIASSATFGWANSWQAWYDKIRIHAVGPSVNNVGLRNVMSYDPSLTARHVLVREHPEPWINWQRTQAETYAARRPMTYLLLFITLLLLALACRGLPLHQVALLGLLGIPFLFYLSNYYCHFIFLLPLAFTGALQRWAFLMLVALCAGQYFSLSEGWSDERYTYQSFLLLGTFWLILLPAAWRGWRWDRMTPAINSRISSPEPGQ